MDRIKNSENLNLLWANIIIEELARNKIVYFCISPGSRSTPLTIAAVKHPLVQSKILYDERGAAFHALGYARANKTPAVLICTSGTAAANYYPAVIEAFQENIPLIILSADRPPELRDTGANQTIDQVNLYGKYTRYFIDLPCPSEEYELSFLLKTIDQAVEKATFVDAGPVHINCMFREPLAPKVEAWPNNYLQKVSEWLIAKHPFSTTKIENLELPERQLNELVKMINDNPKGIILAGRNENPVDQQAIVELAEKIKWPIFADITSGLRLNSESQQTIHFFDQLLLSEKIKEEIQDLPVLHFGGQFVSKRLLQFLENHSGKHIHVLETNKKIDPAKSVTHRIHFPIKRLIDKLLADVNNQTQNALSLAEYNREIINCVQKVSLNPDDKLNEISVAQIISENIINDSALFLASSMPIRDMDMFSLPGTNNVIVGANRGASGIDGTIASAIGFANGIKRPLTLVIGDLTFIHDLSSLTMIKECEYPVTIVLINNQGGGIFSFLPIAEHGDIFERNFGTPHKLTFEKSAEMFGLKYFQPAKNRDFTKLYSQYQTCEKPTLIEIRTNREENYDLHNKLKNQIIQCLSTDLNK